jgi:transposase-like protein
MNSNAQALPEPEGVDEALPDLGSSGPVDVTGAPKVGESSQLIDQHTMNKCPKCGSPDINYLQRSGNWICSFCRYKWDPSDSKTYEEVAGVKTEIRDLVGTLVASAAEAIALEQDQLTLKCTACGAEVIVDTKEANRARCHWCRQTLSLNQKVPNGAVPDAILPFTVTKDQAVANISDFVSKRKFFALPKFTREFEPENVIGVYLPYTLVDGNLSAELQGEAEIQTRTWTEQRDKSSVRYYNADVYRVARKFDYQVDDLTVEASKMRSDIQLGDTQANTNNIINTILPFDTKNAIPYNSAFMAGFNSERRDMNVEAITPVVKDQFMSIARSVATAVSPQYEQRGMRWDYEHIDIKGTRWVSVYLPVWLYSYFEQDKGLLHYVAVNGRTGETMGSVPVNYAKLRSIAIAIGVTLEVASWPILIAALGH